MSSGHSQPAERPAMEGRAGARPEHKGFAMDGKEGFRPARCGHSQPAERPAMEGRAEHEFFRRRTERRN
jgi:hypothetical protein